MDSATTPCSTVAYDANGNTLSDPSGKSYSWDFENRLIQAVVPGTSGGATTFHYDPFGRRIQKSGPLGTTNYLYDGFNLLEEVDQSGNVLARYTQGPGIDQLLTELRSGTSSYYQQDAIGSVTSLSNSAGALANTYAYDSFGNLTASTGTTANPFQYSGREFDAEAGRYFCRARYFDQSIGRFISEDPIRSGMNFYAYVRNNPATFIDPFGLRNCTRTPLGLVCYPDSNPGTTEFDPLNPALPTPPGLPQMPTPVPMPSTFCQPGTDCHDTITPGIPTPTYGDLTFDPCRGWDFDSGVPLPYRGPTFSCSGKRDNCLDAEQRFVDACERAGCKGRVYNGGYTGGVSAACSQKK